MDSAVAELLSAEHSSHGVLSWFFELLRQPMPQRTLSQCRYRHHLPHIPPTVLFNYSRAQAWYESYSVPLSEGDGATNHQQQSKSSGINPTHLGAGQTVSITTAVTAAANGGTAGDDEGAAGADISGTSGGDEQPYSPASPMSAAAGSAGGSPPSPLSPSPNANNNTYKSQQHQQQQDAAPLPQQPTSVVYVVEYRKRKPTELTTHNIVSTICPSYRRISTKLIEKEKERRRLDGAAGANSSPTKKKGRDGGEGSTFTGIGVVGGLGVFGPRRNGDELANFSLAAVAQQLPKGRLCAQTVRKSNISTGNGGGGGHSSAHSQLNQTTNTANLSDSAAKIGSASPSPAPAASNNSTHTNNHKNSINTNGNGGAGYSASAAAPSASAVRDGFEFIGKHVEAPSAAEAAVQYFDEFELGQLLFHDTVDYALLQRFGHPSASYSHDSTYNQILVADWQPSYCFVARSECLLPLGNASQSSQLRGDAADPRVSQYKGTPGWNVQRALCNACNALAERVFFATNGIRIRKMSVVFKIDAKRNRVMLQWCQSAAVAKGPSVLTVRDEVIAKLPHASALSAGIDYDNYQHHQQDDGSNNQRQRAGPGGRSPSPSQRREGAAAGHGNNNDSYSTAYLLGGTPQHQREQQLSGKNGKRKDQQRRGTGASFTSSTASSGGGINGKMKLVPIPRNFTYGVGDGTEETALASLGLAGPQSSSASQPFEDADSDGDDGSGYGYGSPAGSGGGFRGAGSRPTSAAARAASPSVGGLPTALDDSLDRKGARQRSRSRGLGGVNSGRARGSVPLTAVGDEDHHPSRNALRRSSAASRARSRSNSRHNIFGGKGVRVTVNRQAEEVRRLMDEAFGPLRPKGLLTRTKLDYIAYQVHAAHHHPQRTMAGVSGGDTATTNGGSTGGDIGGGRAPTRGGGGIGGSSSSAYGGGPPTTMQDILRPGLEEMEHDALFDRLAPRAWTHRRPNRRAPSVHNLIALRDQQEAAEAGRQRRIRARAMAAEVADTEDADGDGGGDGSDRVGGVSGSFEDVGIGGGSSSRPHQSNSNGNASASNNRPSLLDILSGNAARSVDQMRRRNRLAAIASSANINCNASNTCSNGGDVKQRGSHSPPFRGGGGGDSPSPSSSPLRGNSPPLRPLPGTATVRRTAGEEGGYTYYPYVPFAPSEESLALGGGGAHHLPQHSGSAAAGSRSPTPAGGTRNAHAHADEGDLRRHRRPTSAGNNSAPPPIHSDNGSFRGGGGVAVNNNGFRTAASTSQSNLLLAKNTSHNALARISSSTGGGFGGGGGADPSAPLAASIIRRPTSAGMRPPLTTPRQQAPSGSGDRDGSATAATSHDGTRAGAAPSRGGSQQQQYQHHQQHRRRRDMAAAAEDADADIVDARTWGRPSRVDNVLLLPLDRDEPYTINRIAADAGRLGYREAYLQTMQKGNSGAMKGRR